MEFNHKIPDWQNEGTEPSAELKKNGFLGGWKVPATILNWLFSKVAKAITEIQTKLSNDVVTAETTDGAMYTATVEGVTELYHGMKITIVPNQTNTSATPRLNINNLGDKGIRLALSFNCAATTTVKENFFSAGRPIELKYDANCNLGVQGQGAWIPTDRLKTSAQDLYGVVPIESGGTGVEVKSSDTEEEIKAKARENLGLGNVANITSGSYIGTGTTGGNNKNTLTFNDVPKIVFIFGRNNGSYMIAFYGAREALTMNGNMTAFEHYNNILEWNENTLSWYTGYGEAFIQMNSENTTYDYWVLY